MAEINLDKIYASFLLALEESHDSESLSDLQKEYLGKNSVISNSIINHDSLIPEGTVLTDSEWPLTD